MPDDLDIRNGTDEDLDDLEDCRDCMGRGYLDEYDPDDMCVTCSGLGYIDLSMIKYGSKITW
jgi:hypothetical protein